jgi:hypothetical protein
VAKEESMKDILSVVAGLLYLVAFALYIRAILRDRHLPAGTPGKTEPSKASWIIWASLDSITISGMYVEGTVNGQILGAVIGAWIVVGYAMKYGTPGWTILDKFCLVGAVLGIVLWQMFSSPILGVMISLSVVFLGSIPTFVSAWKDPSRENKFAWVIFTISCVCAIIAIPHWTLADAAQPITFFAVEAVMIYILFVRPRF